MNFLIKKFNFLFFLTLISCFNNLEAQINSDCFNKAQLLRMQKVSLNEMRSFLNNEGWSFISSKKNHNYRYFDNDIEYNLISYENSRNESLGKLEIYYFPEKPNIIKYFINEYCYKLLLDSFKNNKGKTIVNDNVLTTIFTENLLTIEFREDINNFSNKFSIFIYNSNALLKEVEKIKEKELAAKKLEEENKIKYQKALTEGDAFFILNNFEEAKLKYLIAFGIDKNDLIYSKIQNCEKAICNKFIQNGDSLVNLKLFELALKDYENAKNCSNNFSMLDQKIKNVEKLILQESISKINTEAEILFKDKKFNLSLEKYKEIIKLDNSNISSLNRIKEINELQNILKKRKNTIFSYKEVNYQELKKFKYDFMEVSKPEFEISNKGFLNFNYHIEFDTLGNNNSNFTNFSSSNTKFKKGFNDILDKNILTPTIEGGYFLASKDDLNFDLKWSTLRSKINSNSRGVFENYIPITDNKNEIKNFINREPFNYGIYTFEIRNSNLNNDIFQDINLINYKVVGPEAVFLSILMPGMGTLKVSYGKKGWGRFTNFLLTSGIALGSKIYSENQYNKYLEAKDQMEIDKYYNIANISHKISLISTGISASIYLYDIFWVISNGSKNIKRSKQLKYKLKQGPISILKEPILWK